LSNQRFDSFSKQLYDSLLDENFGKVEISLEVPGESLFIDVVFTPSPNPKGDTSILGLLGRSIQHRTIFETYRNPPGIDAINTCMFKRTWYCLELRRRAKRANRPFQWSDEPKLWIVTPTASEPLLKGFGAKTQKDWPKGVYWLADHLYTAIIVVHKLPISPETLWFRLLGKGRVQTNAIQEVLAMPQGDVLRNDALRLLSNWKIIERVSTQPEQTDREFTMALSQAYLEWEKEVQQRSKQEGIQEGRQEGRQEGIQEGRQEGIQEGRQEGIQEGRQEGRQAVALNMLRSGMTVDSIAQLTGLSLQQIQQLERGDVS